MFDLSKGVKGRDGRYVWVTMDQCECCVNVNVVKMSQRKRQHVKFGGQNGSMEEMVSGETCGEAGLSRWFGGRDGEQVKFGSRYVGDRPSLDENGSMVLQVLINDGSMVGRWTQHGSIADKSLSKWVNGTPS